MRKTLKQIPGYVLEIPKGFTQLDRLAFELGAGENYFKVGIGRIHVESIWNQFIAAGKDPLEHLAIYNGTKYFSSEFIEVLRRIQLGS